MPRLELNAAVIGVKLYNIIIPKIDLPTEKKHVLVRLYATITGYTR